MRRFLAHEQCCLPRLAGDQFVPHQRNALTVTLEGAGVLLGCFHLLGAADSITKGLSSALWLAAARYSLEAKAKRVKIKTEIRTESKSERDIAKP